MEYNMARKIKPLTNTEIKQAKPREKVWYLFDGDGLQLAIKPNGSKLWQLKYNSPATEKRRTISFGSYEDVSLAQAREKRRECRSVIAEVKDPIIEIKQDKDREVLKNNNTVKKIIDDWLGFKSTYVEEDTLRKYRYSLNRHVIPKFGDMRIDELTPTIVIAKLEYLKKEKKIDTLRKTIGVLNQVMRYAVSVGYIEFNKIESLGSTLPKHKVTHQRCIAPDELSEFLDAMDNSDNQLVTTMLFKFQLLTMVRPVEARKIEWCDIDMDNRVWTIPPEKIKMRKEHRIQLSDQAIEILNKAKELWGEDGYVFKMLWRGKLKHLSDNTLIGAIRRSGFKDKMTAHGMRTLASTVLNEHEFNPDIIESMLAHTCGGVRAIYNRSRYDDRKREYYQWWADYCVKAGLKI